jgi:hypothetical protein
MAVFSFYLPECAYLRYNILQKCVSVKYLFAASVTEKIISHVCDMSIWIGS